MKFMYFRLSHRKEYKKIIYCINCEDWYRPKYENKSDAPEGSIWREQHISGICSDQCWNQLLKV